MNMNVKLDGEDEQSVHFPNRATIALQSGPAAYINLNIVNPNLGNSGYILNPVNTVPQNLVAYQSPVTLQSYITLQEADGNIVNNLPVGVPVPIGLPVPAELLQNPNLVNTGIIIGNEDCGQPVIFKPAGNNMPEPNDIKISYMPKPVMQEIKQAVVPEDQNMRLNEMTGINLDSVLKKPCPLEMSIKAANIDLEFEKCDPDIMMSASNGLMHQGNYPIMQKLTGHQQMTENMVLNVPVKLNDKTVMDVPVIKQNSDEGKKPKTEITWENHSLQNQATSNEFQESLICEVEEANEDEEDEGDEENAASSSDDNETLVLKLRRVQEGEDEGKNGRMKKLKDAKEAAKLSNKKSAKESEQKSLALKKFMKVRHCCSKKECFKKITLKDQKTAFKNFYELISSAKQDAYLINCMEHIQTSRSLEGETDKEGNGMRAKPADSDDKTFLDAANIQLEIENESNGNQMLSDEIQKAIKESLKDCMANQPNRDDDGDDDDDDDDEGYSIDKGTTEEDASDNSDDNEDDKTQNWNYYIVIERCRKKVCLKFLLKLFRITKKRIKMVQAKILSGQSFSEDSSPFATNGETFDVWDFARIHLNTLASEAHPYCKSNPPHRFLVSESSIEHLYDTFKDFYRERAGKELKAKINTYKRFLKNDTKFSLSGMKPGSCSECDIAEEEDGRKGKKGVKNSASQDNMAKLDRSFQTRKKGRKKWDISSDSECSSDDEPLVKRKKSLKFSLKVGNKVQNADKNYSGGKGKKKTKKDTKPKGNGVRGRDVWSLMLLHLETMPYKICKSCTSRKRHRFFDASMTKQALYEDYRRYFLKETNSELGLGFTMYEKYFDRNCGFTIGDVDVNSPVCPRCALEPPKPEANKSNKKSSKNCNNNFRLARHEETIS